MTQVNVKNIALAVVLIAFGGQVLCSGGSDGLDGSGAIPLLSLTSGAPSEAKSWLREHAKTAFAGVSAAAILGFAAYSSVRVKQLNKKLNEFKSMPRNNRAMSLRAQKENWQFLRNVAWGAFVVAGGLTAWGTAHHLTKGADWATNSKSSSLLAKLGRGLLGHSPVEVISADDDGTGTGTGDGDGTGDGTAPGDGDTVAPAAADTTTTATAGAPGTTPTPGDCDGTGTGTGVVGALAVHAAATVAPAATATAGGHVAPAAPGDVGTTAPGN